MYSEIKLEIMKIINWPKWYVALSMIFVVAFFVYNYENPSTVRSNKFQQDLLLSIKGLLIDKFIDYKNHEYKTCKIQRGDDTLTLLMNLDRSDIFNYLEIGDSIFKKPGDSLVIVKRENNTRRFYLNYE